MKYAYPGLQAELDEAERVREQQERWALIQRLNSEAGRNAAQPGATPAAPRATAPVDAQQGAAASVVTGVHDVPPGTGASIPGVGEAVASEP